MTETSYKLITLNVINVVYAL